MAVGKAVPSDLVPSHKNLFCNGWVFPYVLPHKEKRCLCPRLVQNPQDFRGCYGVGPIVKCKTNAVAPLEFSQKSPSMEVSSCVRQGNIDSKKRLATLVELRRIFA